MANLTTTDLDNGKTDLETLSTVVNSQTESTTSTRLGETIKTVKGLTDEFEQVIADGEIAFDNAIASAGYSIVGDFSDVTKVEITADSQVYTSKSIAGFEGALWRTNQTLPYTPTGSDPTTGAELGKWVAVAQGELKGIARSLNALDSEVIYSTDTTTVLDDVLYIYDASAQTVWGKPSSVGAGETIVSVVGNTLTTSGGVYNLISSNYHIGNSTATVTPEYFGASELAVDNSAALIIAADSGRIIDGGGRSYAIQSPIISATLGVVNMQNITVVTPLEVTTSQVNFSSASQLKLNNFRVESTLSELTAYTYLESISAPAIKYERVNDGIAVINDVSVENYNGLAISINKVATVMASKIRSRNTGLGHLFTGIQSGFINSVSAVNQRRIGFSCQSDENTTDHDDLQISNISVNNTYPGIGSGADLHGIGVEIHNFVDEALATNIRSRNCHSMGVSLSGCEHGNVRNLFVKSIGYTSESDGGTYRGFAGIEIVDSDFAVCEGSVIDCWQSFVRFDKSHFARVNLHCEQRNEDVDTGNIRFIRYQGTANDFNNSAIGCIVEGSYRNNTATLIPLVNTGTFASFDGYRHELRNLTAFNALLDIPSDFRLDGVQVWDDGAFTNTGATPSLIRYVDAGADIDAQNIEYVGLASGAKPQSAISVSSSAVNSIRLRNWTVRNVSSLTSASSGTMAELELHDVQLFDVDGIYSGTISSAFRMLGDDNFASPRVQYIARVMQGNTTSGVVGQAGDRLWKRFAVSGQSPGWVHDGASWVAMGVLT